MNVKTLCLAILHKQETTGYEIRKMSTEGEFAYFVDASYGSIYPALARLEVEGMVVSRVEQQEGRPAKKVYSITDMGRESFHQSLFNDLDDDDFRSEFLLFARFAADLPASLVRKRLKERMVCISCEMEKIEEMRTDDLSKGDLWVLNYGLACLGVAHDHIATHMNDLVALAQPDDEQAAIEAKPVANVQPAAAE
ncbi:hypothetical protein MNBD_ALPHA11-1847 [hydrothermal vent metagenome]|uniref:Transcription regulator PadR N-terminal domain-containing protein n=1 Tax=hydrothermal vent metagenome TaxID=652676 RepID=A0A3B0UYE0_9ZZZZ